MAKPTVPIYDNYIAGRWTRPTTGHVCENRNPANRDDLIGCFPDSSTDDVEAAIGAAREAYDGWRLTPAPKRAEILFRAAQLIVDKKEQFARDMTREMGKVLEEARGDVQEAIDMTYYIAGEGRRLYGQTVPSELPDKYAMSLRQPLGVCSIITPWNFPMAIPSWKIIPALVCGNTVVFKPSELTPLSGLNFVRVLEEAGVPDGVVNMVDRRARGRRAVDVAHRTSPSCRSPAPRPSGARSIRMPRRTSRRCTSRWAARTAS